MPEKAPVTQLLRAWSGGNQDALAELLPLVEAELRRLAKVYMARERRGHTLQATALVNEVFMRLIDTRNVAWNDRAHFLGIAARLMRRVLIDHARSRGMKKRGAGAYMLPLEDDMIVAPSPAVDLLALDAALDALAAIDERKSRVIEMRFFGGMTVEETAVALHVSTDTVKRDWRVAKLWLLKELDGAARAPV
jgi:RNA polymerase sigma factor (TIGR02999 family)